MTSPTRSTTGIKPLFDDNQRLLVFEAREQGTAYPVSINPAVIAYIRPGSHDLATVVRFVGGASIEIVCPYDELRAALHGLHAWCDWKDAPRDSSR